MLRQNQSSVFFLSQFFFPSTSKRHDAHAEGKKKIMLQHHSGEQFAVYLLCIPLEISGGILYLATKIKQIIKLIVGLQKFSL